MDYPLCPEDAAAQWAARFQKNKTHVIANMDETDNGCLLTNEQNVSLEVLGKICAALHVNLGDIAQFVEL